MRNWLHVCVTILDKLEDEFHLGLIGLDRDFLVDSMDAEGEKFGGGAEAIALVQMLLQSTLHPLKPLAFDPPGAGSGQGGSSRLEAVRFHRRGWSLLQDLGPWQSTGGADDSPGECRSSPALESI